MTWRAVSARPSTWDELVMLPEGDKTGEARGRQKAALAELKHREATSAAHGRAWHILHASATEPHAHGDSGHRAHSSSTSGAVHLHCTRHEMPCNSTNQGSKRVSMTWREISARP